ncbi:hypothetical protein scyTo_0003424 [Scyliorhinus torazame]|uniref:Uncharacterized protein n=1 Tax=Scyliorhinus torazame TaxID=75743 RepID=A0A401PML1_SCYTO|nr:hypothetical protein [Scyliorhinus torazame]
MSKVQATCGNDELQLGVVKMSSRKITQISMTASCSTANMEYDVVKAFYIHKHIPRHCSHHNGQIPTAYGSHDMGKSSRDSETPDMLCIVSLGGPSLEEGANRTDDCIYGKRRVAAGN